MVTHEQIEGLMETVRNLYLSDDIPWVIGYSGGKDSTATLQLVWLALQGLSAGFIHKKSDRGNARKGMAGFLALFAAFR